MIYAFLKILSRLTIWGYFRRLKVVGRENIPENGPYIFVANHPSAFMDPIVVASSVKPPLYFIAAGEYVGTGLKGWFFQKILHMIPVFRPSNRPEDAHKNKDMFVRCYEHLSGKGAILIFPEGVSLTEKKLKPLKTGTVRIAIGAEEKNNFDLGVAIIPIGLNYSDPHTFRSDLFVKIGAPIYVRDFIKNQGSDENRIELTRQITTDLERAMQQNMLHLETAQEEQMLEKLETVYAKELRTQFDITFEDQESEFAMQQDIVDAIGYFKTYKPEVYRETEAQIDHYLTQLNAAELTDRDVRDYRKRQNSRRVISFILGLPYFLFGFIHNFLPYRAVGFFAGKIKMDETFQGSLSLAIGLFTFLLWYLGVSVVMGVYLIGWWAVFYPVVMYITGLYALLYVTAIQKSQERKKLRRSVKNSTDTLTKLIHERHVIITALSTFQADYQAYKESRAKADILAE